MSGNALNSAWPGAQLEDARRTSVSFEWLFSACPAHSGALSAPSCRGLGLGLARQARGVSAGIRTRTRLGAAWNARSHAVEIVPKGNEMKNGKFQRLLAIGSLLACMPLHAAPVAEAETGTAESAWLTTASLERAQKICEDESVSEVLWIDGEVQASCAFAFGDTELREQNRLERLQRILRVRNAGRNTDIVYQDAKLREPLVRTLEGIRIDRVEEAQVATLSCEAISGGEDVAIDGDPADTESVIRFEAPKSDTVAWATLEEPFADICSAGPYPMRRDDALGAEAQVVDLGTSGALTMYRGELLWVPYQGASIAPSLRMIWRSDFQVIYDQGSKKSSSSSKSKKKRKKKKRSRR